MRKIFNIMVLACIMIMASCSSENDAIWDNNVSDIYGEDITIGVGMPGGDKTRVALDDLKLSWEEGDQIVAIAKNAEGKTVTSDFTLQNGAGASYATFKGKTINGATSYSLVYKSANLLIAGDGKYSIDYSKSVQNGMNTDTHVENSLLVAKDDVTDLKSNVQLELRTSLMKINLLSLPSELKSVSKVELFVNYNGDTSKPYGTVGFTGNLETGDGKYILMPFNIGDKLNAGKMLAFKFTGNNTTKTVVATSTKGKTYLAGKRYSLKISANQENGTMCTWYDDKAAPADDELWIKLTGFTGNINTSPWNELNSRYEFIQKQSDGWYRYKCKKGQKPDTEGVLGQGGISDYVTEVWLPVSCKKIGKQAFQNCMKLKNIIFADDITYIGGSAFLGCAFEELVVPETVTFIGSDFINGDILKKLVIKSHAFSAENIKADVMSHFESSECNLYLHESWNKGDDTYKGKFTIRQNKDRKWCIVINNGTEHQFKNIFLIDDNGNVTESFKNELNH